MIAPIPRVVMYHIPPSKEFERAFFEADIDGRALSALSRADVRSLARKATVDKATRRRLYDAVRELKEEGAGAEWVALYGSEWLHRQRRAILCDFQRVACIISWHFFYHARADHNSACHYEACVRCMVGIVL